MGKVWREQLWSGRAERIEGGIIMGDIFRALEEGRIAMSRRQQQESSSSSPQRWGMKKETHNLDCASHSILYGCMCIMCCLFCSWRLAPPCPPDYYPSK